ncbi:hypothetical protein GO755_36220 [Spirosoma sp. HMF4905]|uniref:Uncharacterized protein n=1 Tax=Spirosoma arboris TaxID=2682092 RepID=A0A7K1SNY5_9BACT|nr:hypothetical protein [Spirosoma arboris]MVM35524.1 hypothetical protein [Spirosoma arboris]
MKNEPASSDRGDSVLADWLEAIDKLYAYYQELLTCISQGELEQELRVETTTHIGQCPKNQVVKLMDTMQTEVVNLIQDIDQTANLQPPTRERVHAKLVKHTLRLNQLNHQAYTRLCLIKQSSS